MSSYRQIIDGLSAYPHELFKILKWAPDSNTQESDEREEVEVPEDADVIVSRIKDSAFYPYEHTIMLDLDVPAKLVPSSTPGHSHLYIDVRIDHAVYEKLLKMLVRAKVIQPGILYGFERRGFTSLRLPWVKKETKEEAPF